MSINDYANAERDAVAALFEEDAKLTPYDYRPTYIEFRVMSVDGQEAQHRVLVSFYDTQAYIDPHKRDPWKTLKVIDLDVRVRYGQVGNYANKTLHVLNAGHSFAEVVRRELRAEDYPARPEAGLLVEHGAKLSLRAMLEEAYQLGGYGEYPDRKNSNGVTAEEARSIAVEAIGPAARHAIERNPEGIAAAAREAAASIGKDGHGRARERLR